MREMITCEQVREGLREYLDAAAPPGDGIAVQRHLVDCESCRGLVRSLRDTSRLLSTLPNPPMPAEMKDSLLEAFRHRPRA